MSGKDLIGIETFRGAVLPDWIDVNAHMNVAYYVLAFDYGVDALWHRFGITDEYVANERGSTFAVESHVTWQREMKAADPYIITTQILAFDEKRIHQFMRMYHAEKYYLAATAEWMNLYIDLNVRRVSPWPDAIRREISRIANAQTDLAWPAEVGRQMQIKQALYRLAENR